MANTSECLGETSRPLRWLAPLILFVLLHSGCGGGLTVPSTVPVRGVVKYMGSPTPGIRVTLHPEGKAGKIGFVSTGETGPDGGFTLSTGAPSNGAPPGKYIVTFEMPVIAPPETTGYVETEIDAFGGKYSDPQKSEVRVTISHGENVLTPFELQ